MCQSKLNSSYSIILHKIFTFYCEIKLFLSCYSPADASLLQKIIRKGLIESKSELDIIRQDPSSPLYSAKTFEELKL